MLNMEVNKCSLWRRTNVEYGGEQMFVVEADKCLLVNRDKSNPIPFNYDLDGDDELNHEGFMVQGISEEMI